jgi:hypothetical protein
MCLKVNGLYWFDSRLVRKLPMISASTVSVLNSLINLVNSAKFSCKETRTPPKPHPSPRRAMTMFECSFKKALALVPISSYFSSETLKCILNKVNANNSKSIFAKSGIRVYSLARPFDSSQSTIKAYSLIEKH